MAAAKTPPADKEAWTFQLDSSVDQIHNATTRKLWVTAASEDDDICHKMKTQLRAHRSKGTEEYTNELLNGMISRVLLKAVEQM